MLLWIDNYKHKIEESMMANPLFWKFNIYESVSIAIAIEMEKKIKNSHIHPFYISFVFVELNIFTSIEIMQ